MKRHRISQHKVPPAEAQEGKTILRIKLTETQFREREAEQKALAAEAAKGGGGKQGGGGGDQQQQQNGDQKQQQQQQTTSATTDQKQMGVKKEEEQEHMEVDQPWWEFSKISNEKSSWKMSLKILCLKKT